MTCSLGCMYNRIRCRDCCSSNGPRLAPARAFLAIAQAARDTRIHPGVFDRDTRVVLRGQLRTAMPKRPTEEQMERAVAAGDPPVSAKHPADEEWLAAQQNWLASRRTAARALQKR